MADHMKKAARLAARLFCQRARGSAPQEWAYDSDLREDGFSRVGATYGGHVMYWIKCCPAEGAAPVPMLERLPFADPLTT
eukprot:3234483-Pyramimonas_sp.AAC.1